jgi:DNA polymerase III epsilon subunit-like protein
MACPPLIADLCYNAGYDVQLLKETAARYRIKLPKLSTHCLMIQYSDFISFGSKRDAYPKLEAACAHFGIPAGKHRALADANAVRQVLLHLAALAK